MHPFSLRAGDERDAPTIAALAVQVFLDTYATAGVRADLAREAFREYSEQAFAQRIALPNRRFVLAEVQDALVAFAELDAAPQPVVDDIEGWELVRLYVQPQAQRSGIGSALIRNAEAMARESGAGGLWLTVWEGNARSLAFYAAMGYSGRGVFDHVIEGRTYGNKVLAKQLPGA